MRDGRGTMHLIIEGEDRVMMRTVGRASDLAPDVPQGTAAEDASRSAAAIWSLPDFAFKSVVIDKGQANREVGDTLIVSGTEGLVVQVKSRVGATDRPDRETQWVKKNAKKGARQAAGSIRYLADHNVVATNERGNEVTIRGPETRWLSLIIIDHPDALDVNLDAPAEGEPPRVVLSRRDWEFLFDQLRSTHAVIRYLWRVADEPDELNREPGRYYDLAQDDEEATSTPMDPAVYGEGVQMSAGLLPLAPAEGREAEHELMVRAVMDSVATADGLTPEQQLVVLSELDELLPGSRAELGATLLANLEKVQQVEPPECLMLTRTVRGRPPTPQLLFSAATYLDEKTTAWFQGFLTVRHHDFSVALGHPEEMSTVGVLLTPRRDGLDGWETTAIRLQGRCDEDHVEELRIKARVRPVGEAQEWPSGSTAVPALGASNKVGRNTPCPCGSGLKFKRCCGR